MPTEAQRGCAELAGISSFAARLQRTGHVMGAGIVELLRTTTSWAWWVWCPAQDGAETFVTGFDGKRVALALQSLGGVVCTHSQVRFNYLISFMVPPILGSPLSRLLIQTIEIAFARMKTFCCMGSYLRLRHRLPLNKLITTAQEAEEFIHVRFPGGQGLLAGLLQLGVVKVEMTRIASQANGPTIAASFIILV